jgi:transcriptional regulator with XRE-family HTH domain
LNSRLLELRGKAGLSQRELSERLKMARTTYSGYENGSREPDHETLKRIADFYHVSTDYLLGREENNEYKTKENSNEMIIKEIVSKYNVDLSVPGTKEKLEQIIQLVLGDSKSQK